MFVELSKDRALVDADDLRDIRGAQFPGVVVVAAGYPRMAELGGH